MGGSKLEGKSSGDDAQRGRDGFTMARCVQSRPPFIVLAQNEHGDLPHELMANRHCLEAKTK